MIILQLRGGSVSPGDSFARNLALGKEAPGAGTVAIKLRFCSVTHAVAFNLLMIPSITFRSLACKSVLQQVD